MSSLLVSPCKLQSSIAYRGAESTTGNKVRPTIRHVCILQSDMLQCGMTFIWLINSNVEP